MQVTVIITVLNEAGTVADLLEGLRAQTRPPDEIVFVDGGSTDGTVAALEATGAGLPLRVVVDPGAGISRGRNRSVRESAHDLLAVTDAGCRPFSGWLERLLAPLEDRSGTDLVCGSYRLIPRTDFEDCVGRCSGSARLRLQGQYVRPTARSLAFTRAAWEKAGGFPEETHVLDDLGFVLSLVDCGGKLKTASAAIVGWRPRSSYRAVLRQFHLYARDTTRGGRTSRMYLWTLFQDVLLAGLLLWGLVMPGPLPWVLMVAAIGVYLFRKARTGCFGVPGWKTLYRVPLILAIIHLGVLTGIARGLFMRLYRL
ncbi:MAG: glycosyltransferase [PVC group bacterium]